ncbi:MAG: hypothetical protein PUD59_04980 [bacterium]|nr:hypothetical protein [bacterium]
MKMTKIFKFTFIILILIFMFLIIASKSGYYEYELSNKKKLTEEAIERFEFDVKEGKNIDIDNYIDTTVENYNNKVSNLGNKVSNSIENFASTCFKYIFNYINREMNK